MRLENAPVTMPAACSGRVVTSALWLLLFTCVAVRPLAATLVQEQFRDFPPFLTVRVPVAPIPVRGDDGVHLVYELYVSNIDRLGRKVTLKRVHALASDGTTLLSYEDAVLQQNLGPPLGTDREGTERSRIAPGMLAVVYMWVTVDSPASVPALIRHRLTVEYVGEDGDTITTVLEGSPAAPHGEAVVIGPPLRGGTWRAGSISNNSDHRRFLLPTSGSVRQRFAIDYVRVNEFGRTYSGAPPFLDENSYSYGADVLAVADAVVVSMHDGVLVGFSPGGSYVALDLGDDRYATYGHLQSGSVRVQAGDRVRRGQVLGRVGSSGSPGAVHLHFDLATTPWIRFSREWFLVPVGEGLPYVHESFVLVCGCTCIGADCSVRAAERREFEMPLRGAVIRFPEEADRGGSEHTATEVGAARSEAVCRAMEARYLTRGNVHRIPEAITAYAEAEARDPTLTIPPRHWGRLCWVGSLWGHAAEVMPACEQAVALEPDHGIWSSNRGLARSLTGDFEGAIADFETYVSWERRDSRHARYQAWIDVLRAGQNPFTPEVLERLKN